LEVEEMIVMLTFTWPTTSSIELAKAGLKNFQENPLPDSARLIGPFYAGYEGGLKCYNILEIENGKEEEVYQVLNKRLANYVPVPGIGWTEERVFTMEEAYPLLNMEAPKR
jgi:hypothetical protein